MLTCSNTHHEDLRQVFCLEFANPNLKRDFASDLTKLYTVLPSQALHFSVMRPISKLIHPLHFVVLKILDRCRDFG